MPYLSSFLLITGIYLVVLASPGPNFFILSQMALDGRRRDAHFVALGIASGSVFWVLVALAGVATLLTQHPWLATAVRLMGAAYLVWYGARLLWAAFLPPPPRTGVEQPVVVNGSRFAAFRIGLLTCITNPKGAAFWTSAFAAIFPAAAPLWFYGVTIVLVGAMSLGWHVAIALMFGTEALRSFYLRIERGVNGVAGGVLVLLGLQRMFAR